MKQETRQAIEQHLAKVATIYGPKSPEYQRAAAAFAAQLGRV